MGIISSLARKAIRRALSRLVGILERSRRPSLGDLPVEIVQQIVNHVDRPTLPALRLTCSWLKLPPERRLFRIIRVNEEDLTLRLELLLDQSKPWRQHVRILAIKHTAIPMWRPVYVFRHSRTICYINMKRTRPKRLGPQPIEYVPCCTDDPSQFGNHQWMSSLLRQVDPPRSLERCVKDHTTIYSWRGHGEFEEVVEKFPRLTWVFFMYGSACLQTE